MYTYVCVFQVALGEAVSSSMSSYLQEQEAAGGVSCKVITGAGLDYACLFDGACGQW